MPLVHDLDAFLSRTAGPDREGDAPVIKCDGRLRVAESDAQEMTPSPQIEALPFH